MSVVFIVVGAVIAMRHPDTPLPSQWNPTVPLVVSDPISPLTDRKLRRAATDPQVCLDALDQAATMAAMPDSETSETCHIRNRVSLSHVGGARIEPIETTCAIALRMAMWERHGVQPAARDIFGADVTMFHQIGSYNCRRIRSSQGVSNRWSTHATADAIDIVGFSLSDGQTITLIEDWNAADDKAAFLRAVHSSACRWFVTALGPHYNALHADHFHLQSRGWRACR